MTKTEMDAVRDMLENARLVREAAKDGRDKSRQMRLEVGAVMLEETARVIAWRAEERAKAA